MARTSGPGMIFTTCCSVFGRTTGLYRLYTEISGRLSVCLFVLREFLFVFKYLFLEMPHGTNPVVDMKLDAKKVRLNLVPTVA